MIRWLKILFAERKAGLAGQAKIYAEWGDWRPCKQCNTFWFCRERVRGCRQKTVGLDGPRTDEMMPEKED